MNPSNFLDGNIWLALIWDRHEHAELARCWFDEAHDGSFLFCRFTQLTVLRLLTTTAVMGGDVRTRKHDWKIWDKVEVRRARPGGHAPTRASALPEPAVISLA